VKDQELNPRPHTPRPAALPLRQSAAQVGNGAQEGEYGEAWTLASAHRVDLNLLVDYNWPAFLSQVCNL